MKENIALFGGSFNPIHNGHLALAGLAVDFMQLDKLFFIPTADHPFDKASLQIPFKDRLSMLERAITTRDEFFTYDGESRRDGPSYAIETIEEFQKQYPDSNLYYIIGADNVEHFNKWHQYKKILDCVTLLVTSRPGYSMNVPSFFDSYQLISLPSPEWALSSSKVREYLSKRFTCTGLIPDSTMSYIKSNNLYQ